MLGHRPIHYLPVQDPGSQQLRENFYKQQVTTVPHTLLERGSISCVKQTSVALCLPPSSWRPTPVCVCVCVLEMWDRWGWSNVNILNLRSTTVESRRVICTRCQWCHPWLSLLVWQTHLWNSFPLLLELVGCPQLPTAVSFPLASMSSYLSFHH